MRVRVGLAACLGAILIASAGGGGANAQSPSVAPEPASSGALVVTLASIFLSEYRDTRLELVRTTLQPGAELQGIGQPGTALSRVESGSVAVTTTDGRVTILRAPDVVSELDAGASGVVLAGQSIVSDVDATMTWFNVDSVPAVILTSRLLDAPEMRRADPDPAALQAPVFKRFVTFGPRLGGTRGRFTVKDRSGKVVRARVPTQRELRFWSPVGSGVGPLAQVRPGLRELLLFWEGGVCGPIVTLDVAKDLRTITRTDRSPGCDAAATGHWLVLQLRTGWFDPARIRFTWAGSED